MKGIKNQHKNMSIIRIMLQRIIILLFVVLFGATPSYAFLQPQSHIALFNNLPRVALLVKEQYVDPERINPDAMLAAILESIESRISKLVVSLPKSLEKALEILRATDEQKATLVALEKKLGQPKTPIPASGAAPDAPAPGPAALLPAPAPAAPGASAESGPLAKEKLTVDLGGAKKIFDYEPQRSIWGMMFLLRDVFSFIEAEAKKQGLTEKRKGEEPIEWSKIETAAINALLGTLDPHSGFFEAKYARDLELTATGKFGGIGTVISVQENFITIISPIEGTPAARAGIKAKDRIVKIDDDSAINMDINDAVERLRGEPGTTVIITVLRPSTNKEMEFTLKRAIIKVDSVAYMLLEKNVGYLKIKTFQGNTALDVKGAIVDLKKKASNRLNGLVLDLRGNPGGLLREAVEVASLFLNGGEVVSTQGSRADSRQVEMASSGELDPQLKVVVLADGGSASASEIVAAAIKNGGPKNGRGVVVGERTFGKGSVQMLFDFPSADLPQPGKQLAGQEKPVEPAALKLTVAEYFGPNHTPMQNIGVIPDVALAPVFAHKREELSLFYEPLLREADLEGHLSTDKGSSDNKKTVEKSLVSIEFLAPKPDQEAAEYGKLNVATLKNDFAVTVASDLIKASKSVDRTDLLANADSIRARLQAEQQKKISTALKEFGIDWSEGKTTGQGSLRARIVENKAALAGNKLTVAIEVENTSNEPMFQVHGITHSKTPLFNQRELLFGKLNPGQKIVRNVSFEIPKDVVTRKDLLGLELRDYRREKITDFDVPLEIKGLGRPRFAHLAYVDDTKTGNGNGRVENGEDVELAVWIKNIGDGKAFSPTVLLKNESGSKVFLKNGRFQSGEVLPNQETSAKFSFRIKEPTDKVELELQIFDGEMHDIWRDKIVVDVKTKQAAKAVSKKLIVKGGAASILAAPVDGGQKIASVKEGLHVEAIKEINDYWLVKVADNLSGFIKKSQTKDGPKTDVSDAKKKKNALYSISYARIPPHVSLSFGDASGWSRKETGKITADIADAANLSSLLLYVNGKKVLYKDISKISGKQKFEQTINLRPGVNIVSLFAREDATYGQRENITIFYDDEGKAAQALSKSTVEEAKSN